MKILKTILQSFKKTKILIILFFILSIILNYLVTYIPVVIQYFIDIALKTNTNNLILDKIYSTFSNNFNFIGSTCIVLIFIQLLIIISTYMRNIAKSKIIQEFQCELKLKLFTHIQNLSYQDFYNNSLADLVQSSTDDVNNIVNFINTWFTYILDIILIVVFAIFQIVNIDYRLSIIMIVSSILIMLLTKWYFSSSKKVLPKIIEMRKKLYSKFDDNLNNLKFIKLNNLQEKEIKTFSNILDESDVYHKEKVKIDASYNKGIELIVKLQAPFIFILSGYLYIKSKVTIGSIYVTLNYSNKVTKSFTDIAELIEGYSLFIESYKRLAELLELTQENENVKNDLHITNRKIIFKNASIIVNGKIILKDLNFTINENEKVIICGATGSGKSILLKTLVGFYEYTGSIKIGNIEVRDLNKKEIRENICLLLQDSYLFSRTIAENIKILVPCMPYEDMVSMSKFFSFDEDVKKLKDGYDSEIGKRGTVLSKGQRQRLVLIRAFTKPKPIMIFDDSFSAIDRVNKSNILNNLMNIKTSFTKIFVSHNIDLARLFDKVIFLENETAVVSTYEELIRTNKNYKNIHDLSIDNIGEEYV